MSTASSDDYTSAAICLDALIRELAGQGLDTTSGEQWLARLQTRARDLGREERDRERIVKAITTIAIEAGLRSESGDNDDLRAFARNLLQHFEIREVEECPF